MPKKHYVVVKGSSGNSEKHPLKAWLKDHPSEVPAGRDAFIDTSYQLRRALKRVGWELEELDDTVLLIRPDESGETDFADTLFGLHGLDESPNDESVIEEAEEITFGLERDLQSALRRNINQLEAGLSIADNGKERKVEGGLIDITAKDQTGRKVILELKAGKASPDVIAQILAYMSCVAEEDDCDVRGIIIAGDFHPRVVLAARAIPNLELRKYSFTFTFEEIR